MRTRWTETTPRLELRTDDKILIQIIADGMRNKQDIANGILLILHNIDDYGYFYKGESYIFKEVDILESCDDGIFDLIFTDDGDIYVMLNDIAIEQFDFVYTCKVDRFFDNVKVSFHKHEAEAFGHNSGKEYSINRHVVFK